MKRLLILVLLAAFFLAIFSFPAKTTYTETVAHIVASNETLWSIAKKYNPNKDIRRVVDEIRKINNCSALIRIGQELEVPVWR